MLAKSKFTSIKLTNLKAIQKCYFSEKDYAFINQKGYRRDKLKEIFEKILKDNQQILKEKG